jgi:Ca2+-transporting ATPase
MTQIAAVEQPHARAMQFAYRYPADEIVKMLDSDAIQGLTTARAQEYLSCYGANALPEPATPPAWRKFLSQFQGPLTLLLLLAMGVSVFAWLNERDTSIPFEALTILVIVLLNGVLGYIQEHRAEQAVAALQAMSAPMARVLRDGEPQRIPATQVVPGDILLIEEGDTLPADARVLEAFALRVAESALTGESTPVEKTSTVIKQEAGIGDQSNMVFSSTLVTSGRGRAIVTRTGAYTEIGKIAGSLEQSQPEQTPLQKELDYVGKVLGVIVIAIIVVVGITILLVDRVTALADLIEVLLLAVSLAVAAVPEGLTAITTVVLSLGMRRMAGRHVIVRKLSAVETLGSTTVICTDKTGTLTKNEVTVRSLVTASGRVDFSGSGYTPKGAVLHHDKPISDSPLLHEVERALQAASLANNARLHYSDGRWTIQGDPTEGALLVAAQKLHLQPQTLQKRFPRVNELPFSSERKLMSTVHAESEREERVRVFSKGAPDVLLTRCTCELVGKETRQLSPGRRSAILAAVDQLAGEALRTLGVAFRTLPAGAHNEEAIEQELVWIGVIGMIDPPRPEAMASIRQAKQAGIRVIMITGDHPAMAEAIAKELDIIKAGDCAVGGTELRQMSDERLAQVVMDAAVFARVAPEHKLRIVRALKANGEIVAMTGDGVNDAPALKAADIGVAMGITGTDVSKGAADMILVDDNFASIVAAVEEGRSIFRNIQEFLRFLLSSNLGEVMTMFFGVLLAGVIGLMPEPGAILVVPLVATQILWINLLTDSGPALALGVEPSKRDTMHQPPRNPRSRVISKRMWFDILFVGVVMATGTLLVMDWALPGGLLAGKGTLHYAQTMAFTTLIFFQLFNVLNTRSAERSAFLDLFTNKWIWLALFVSVVLQLCVVYLPFLQVPFGTVALSVTDWLVCIGVASFVLWFYELLKLVRHGREKNALKNGPLR